MIGRFLRVTFALTTILLLTGCFHRATPKSAVQPTTIAMKFTSPAFEHNSPIPSLYTCDGRNLNPPLQCADYPAGTKSLAIIMDDPDAPSGDFVHWTVWNIPPALDCFQTGVAPTGAAEGMTDFGKPGYGGPCPPSGTHRYHFRLYALDTMLDLPTTTTKPVLLKAMEGHILGQALFIGTYQRV